MIKWVRNPLVFLYIYVSVWVHYEVLQIIIESIVIGLGACIGIGLGTGQCEHPHNLLHFLEI